MDGDKTINATLFESTIRKCKRSAAIDGRVQGGENSMELP